MSVLLVAVMTWSLQGVRFPTGDRSSEGLFVGFHMAVVVKTVMGSHFGVGKFTTHFRTYSSGWIESDVHWGPTDLAFDAMAPVHLPSLWPARFRL